MPEFLRLIPPKEALGVFLRTMPEGSMVREQIATADACGRILAVDIRSPHALPEFRRSTVDGYAVRSGDTLGASEAQPGYLELIGEVATGTSPGLMLQPGTCAIIHTGGMLPENANAVIMLEYTQQIRTGIDEKIELEFVKAVTDGENTLQVGEDVHAGQMIMTEGMRIGPAEIGGCMALGINQLTVSCKPRVGILSTGDEIVPPDRTPQPGQVRDVNSYTLAAIVSEAGGVPGLYGIIPDYIESLQEASVRALRECDALIVTAGSSASARDMTAGAISSLGEPGILVHGVNIRPGKPTILAVCQGKPVIGLPGNPVSAFVIAKLFAIPMIRKLLGEQAEKPAPAIKAQLTVNFPSSAGREDWFAVRLHPLSDKYILENIRYEAEPVFSKSNLIFSLVGSDGLVQVPADTTGLRAGEIVDVILL
jgi:molybdopterin molybdotransferase